MSDQTSRKTRVTKLEAIQPATAKGYRSFASEAELEACTDDLRAVKVYIGISPDDWDSEAVNHDDD